MRAARLWAGAGQALAAEWLAADNRADLVAVDVDVADAKRVNHALHPVVDAGVQTERQSVAGGIDGLHHGPDLIGAEGGQMQDRAEDFARHVGDAGHADHHGGDEMALCRGGNFGDHAAFGAGLGDICRDVGSGVGVDHGAHVSGKRPRIAQREFGHGTGQHVDQRLGDVFLNIKAAQGRTALTCRLEGRAKDVAHRLFGQGGAVDQHRVQATGFGYEGCAGMQMFGHRAADRLGGFGGTGEGDAIDARVTGQRRADAGPLPRQQLQGGGGHARTKQKVNRQPGDQRGLFGGFGDHGVACGECCGNLAGEDGKWKVPRADADKGAARRQFEGFGKVGVVAQEIDGFAQFAARIGEGLASLARQKRQDRAVRGVVQIGSVAQDLGAGLGRGVP